MADRPTFSLRMLLAFTTAAAASAALCAAPQAWKPDWRLGVFAFVVMASVPASAIVGILCAGRYGRAFSIGVLTTGSWMATLLLVVMHGARTTFVGKGMSFATGIDFWTTFARNAAHDVGALTACSLVVGLVCVLICWCIGSPRT